MQIDQDIESWLRLGLTEGVGGGALRRLLIAFGDPARVLAASRPALEGVVKNRLPPAFFSARWMKRDWPGPSNGWKILSIH